MGDVPRIIGRYEVERLLGEGGMGVLYLARDPVIDRHVALKLLRVNGEDLRRRFMREAQSAGRLQHPNIVTVYDVGDHDGQLYIAMEYIDGDTLATLIRDDVPFSAIRKLDIVDEIADGLGYAHQRGIIHRDIKPANLMISRAGLVKVLDFGIARLSHRESGDIDGPTLIGTPAYMAPEQLEGAEVDARSDIYAVGLVMYELFSGRRAFIGANTADVLQQVLAAQPTPIDRLVPDIDPDLAHVISRAMTKQPRDRYQDLQSMRKDLARARRRAMQASADDATIVVSAPLTGPLTSPVQPPARSVPVTVVPTPPPTPATGPRAQEDVALAHLAAQRTSRTTMPVADETIYAPVAPVAPVTPVPPVSPVSAAPTVPPPEAEPAASAPPPLPTPPVAAPAHQFAEDDGPMPVPLPAVPSSGVFALPGAGRSTVDASVIAAARDRATAPAAADLASPGESATPRAASAPRHAVPSAPPPLATPGAVQALTTPMPSARRGVPAAVIVAGMVAVLGICFLAAYLAVRAFGLLPGGSFAGLLTQTVEPKVTGPASSTAADPTGPASTTAPGGPGTEVPVTVAEEVPSVVAPSVEQPAGETPAVTSPEPPPATTPEPVAPPVTPPAEQRPATPVTRTPPARETRQATRPTPPAQTPVRPTAPPARDTPREAPPVVVAEAPPRPIERREPDPPPVLAPDDEGLSLVRAYVAARNTAHASGIRRVWPGVDDTHLRRVTSSFSAPLTLSRCEVTASDAAHATATCQLTQPGTTGAYAPGQALTIRRTFVFDLVRQGRTWVIAGLRE
jgi:serine/threonine protein kinase